MDKTIKSISEVIDLACKGLMPIRNEFIFQTEVFRVKGIDVQPGREYWNFQYWNDDYNTSIHFHFADEKLKRVELTPLDDDTDDLLLLFESTWTPSQIKDAYYNFGMML